MRNTYNINTKRKGSTARISISGAAMSSGDDACLSEILMVQVHGFVIFNYVQWIFGIPDPVIFSGFGSLKYACCGQQLILANGYL